ncbi:MULTISPECIES: hypothetical protein [Pseudomonas]|nr:MULTISPECIES: hypothetical protein [Pseudomonas]UUN89219.1 hypothetical protein LUU92_02180 [Pseudomonas extremorientalis]
MAIDGSTRAADKKRQKTLGIKAFFDLGRHSHLLNKSTECMAPGGNQAV